MASTESGKGKGGRSASEYMLDARDGQQMMDLEAWGPKLASFIERQPEVKGRVVVRDLERPGTGTAGGNAVFEAELDLGDGPSSCRYVVRYAPPKSSFHEYDMPSMYKIHSALQGTGVPIARPCWLDGTGEFLGVPAFIMEYVDGDVPRQAYFQDGPLAEAQPSDRRVMVSNVIKTIAGIHAVDWQGRGLAFLQDRGRGRTLIERDMSWYWDLLESSLPDRVDEFRPMWDWLVRNQPILEEPVLTHGDSQPGNYMFRGVEVAAVLDWEMCCLLSRESDLAYLCLANQVTSSFLDKLPDGVPPDEEWLTEYEEISGHKIRNWDYYYMMMLYRLTMIMSCGCARIFPPDQLEATRPMWGFFEDRLMERMKEMGIKS